MRLALVGLVTAGLLLGAGGAGQAPGTTQEAASAPQPAGAGAPERVAGPELEALRADLDQVLAAPGWRRATWGVLAVSLDHGDTLFARSPRQALAPASNVKLFTTAAALHYLGSDFRFRTFLLGTGPVVDGVLQGDLVLFGTGDPGLSDRFYPSRSAVMDSLAARLSRFGVREVSGRVLGDGTFFSGPDRLPAWDPADLNDWFAAASPALSYNENVVTLRVEAGAVGTSPRVHTLPDHGGVAYRNEALTVAGRPRARLVVQREAPLEPILITGDMPVASADVWRRMTVQDPVLFAAHALEKALGDAGIRVGQAPGTVAARGDSPLSPGVFQAGTERTPRLLAQHVSPPLADYLQVVNQESHNLFADLLLRTLGRIVEGEGSYRAGARAVERFLTHEVGLPAGSVHLVDGSGLATENRASPAAFVALLDYLSRNEEWPAFWASLPEAGSRQLPRMRRTPAAGNLRAKTGTIRGVSALSGVVQTPEGERIAFSIVGNDLPSAWGAKRLEDRIAARLAAWAGPQANARSGVASRADASDNRQDGAPRR